MIDIPLDEEKTKEIADKVLVELTKKIKEDIAVSFYDEMSGYLYEHYDNIKEKIENELIEKMVGRYTQEPDHYKFKELRAQIFQEHKDTILESMTDDAIKDSVEKVIERYTHKDYMFEWRWIDGIADFVCNHPEKFLDNERFEKRIALRVKNLQDENERLKKRVGEYEF